MSRESNADPLPAADESHHQARSTQSTQQHSSTPAPGDAIGGKVQRATTASKLGRLWTRKSELVGKLIVFFSLVVSAMALWPTFTGARDGGKSTSLAQWTAKKDYFEFCEAHDWQLAGCNSTKEEPPGPPPTLDSRGTRSKTQVASPPDPKRNFHRISALAHVALFVTCGIAMALRMRWFRRELPGLLARHLRQYHTAPDEGATGGLPTPERLDSVPNGHSTTIDTLGQTAGSTLRRRRVVKSPEKTSPVREIMACYRCRLNKSPCDPTTTGCKPCRKRPLPELGCVRKGLVELVPPQYAIEDYNDLMLLIPDPNQLSTEDSMHGFVSCSDSISSPLLVVTARPYELPDQELQGTQGWPGWGIRPNEQPSEDAIYCWAEAQILAESRTDFETEMDRLLLKFVRRLETTPQPDTEKIHLPLLSDVLKMRCMWKTLSCEELFFRKRPESTGTELDSWAAPVRDSLRLLAVREISELERRILPRIDLRIFRTSRGDLSTLRRLRLNIERWCLLWPLILTHRRSLNGVSGEVLVDENKDTRTQDKKQLFEALVVIYSALFNKPTKVKGMKHADALVFGNDTELHAVYRAVWQRLPDFYHRVLHQGSPMDGLFVEYIVKKESEILERAPAPSVEVHNRAG